MFCVTDLFCMENVQSLMKSDRCLDVKKCSSAKFTLSDFLGPTSLDSPNWGTSNSRKKIVNSPFKGFASNQMAYAFYCRFRQKVKLPFFFPSVDVSIQIRIVKKPAYKRDRTPRVNKSLLLQRNCNILQFFCSFKTMLILLEAKPVRSF